MVVVLVVVVDDGGRSFTILLLLLLVLPLSFPLLWLPLLLWSMMEATVWLGRPGCAGCRCR